MTPPGTATPLRNYTVDMTKLLHVIVVSDDLVSYQHVHPALGKDGHFTTDLHFPEPGHYHVFADCVPAGVGNQVFRFDVSVGGGGGTPARELPTLSTARAGPYLVSLAGTTVHAGRPADLAIHVLKGSAPARDLQLYLGAPAHAVFIGAQDLDYVHVHPTAANAAPMKMDMGGADMGDMDMSDAKPSPDMHLRVTLRNRGAYVLFLQFQGGGMLHVARFGITAS